MEAMGLEPTNLLTASQALYQLSYAPVAPGQSPFSGSASFLLETSARVSQRKTKLSTRKPEPYSLALDRSDTRLLPSILFALEPHEARGPQLPSSME